MDDSTMAISIFGPDSSFATVIAFSGPGFHDCMATRADLLCTESTEVTSKTHRETNDLKV